MNQKQQMKQANEYGNPEMGNASADPEIIQLLDRLTELSFRQNNITDRLCSLKVRLDGPYPEEDNKYETEMDNNGSILDNLKQSIHRISNTLSEQEGVLNDIERLI